MSSYPITEIFYSLQGEGYFTGTPAVFVRFYGCNLCCPFCDTRPGGYKTLTEDEVVRAVSRHSARHVVLTGGEPSLYVTPSLLQRLHGLNKFVAIETNGTRLLPEGIDWITLSPKDAFVSGAALRLSRCDELKVVFTGMNVPDYSCVQATHRFLQPCDMGDSRTNDNLLREAVAWVKVHPDWRLSLQTHKIIGIR